MRRRWTIHPPRRAMGSVCSLLLACAPESTTVEIVPPVDAPTVDASPVGDLAIGVDALRRHVAFLASDDQEGRPPGGEADARVQTYIEAQIRESGLGPAFDGAFRQPFTVIDGVLVRTDQSTALEVGGAAIPHAVVPFGSDTSQGGPVVANLVFVGHGLARDYEKLARKVRGKVVVVLAGGPPDPSLTPAELRPQTKVITAREHQAAGVIVWDPAAQRPLPNRGEANDLGLPVVFVGAEGNAALLGALTGKTHAPDAPVDPAKLPLPPGTQSRNKATLHTPIEPRTMKTANVAGILEGGGSASGVIVVGAHMDHLGMGSAASLAPDEHAVHNGADDNASGVALMLEVCRALGAIEPQRRSHDVLCVAFGAEEMGLLGSKHFVRTLPEKLRGRIAAMVNFDMVGRLGKDGVMIAGVGTSSVWPALIDEHTSGLVVVKSDDGFGPSDHSSFYEAEIPVLHFFTGPHEDYHKPSDDIEKINFEGAGSIGTMALGIVGTLGERALVPDYKKTERKSPGGERQAFRVSLGTIPDYAAAVDGLALSGVRAGGPAEKAGLRKGDVIKVIGEREIHNIDDFMAMFAVLQPGENTRVVIERDGQVVTLELVPAAPQSH